MVLIAYETTTLPLAAAKRNGWRIERVSASPAVLRPFRNFSAEWDYFKPITKGASTWVIYTEPEREKPSIN